GDCSLHFQRFKARLRIFSLTCVPYQTISEVSNDPISGNLRRILLSVFSRTLNWLTANFTWISVTLSVAALNFSVSSRPGTTGTATVSFPNTTTTMLVDESAEGIESGCQSINKFKFPLASLP